MNRKRNKDPVLKGRATSGQRVINHWNRLPSELNTVNLSTIFINYYNKGKINELEKVLNTANVTKHKQIHKNSTIITKILLQGDLAITTTE